MGDDASNCKSNRTSEAGEHEPVEELNMTKVSTKHKEEESTKPSRKLDPPVFRIG